VEGGTTITITGGIFQQGASVTIGGAACTAVSVDSASQITCVTPAHSVGAVDVIVTSADAKSTTLSLGFLYTPPPGSPPAVTSVSPTTGSTLGGTAVSITGTSFATGATVTVGGTTCAAPTVINSTLITCLTAAHVSGSADIIVRNPDLQTGALAGGFTYNAPPTVSSLTPANGSTLGGTSLIIRGTGFGVGTTATVGSVACTSITLNFADQLTCITPAHAAGLVDVVVTNADAQTVTFPANYTFIAPPTVSSVSPATGTTGGSTFITITGTTFAAGATVQVGGEPCSNVSINSSTQITCSTPAHAVGPVSVVVNSVTGLSGTLNAGYSYITTAAPTVTSISPSSGPAAGGSTITLTGTGFLAGATVRIASNICTSPNVLSTTQMTCVTPAHAVGATDIRVTNTDGQLGSLTSGFTYVAAPTINAAASIPPGVVPTFGPSTGGNTVTISGSGFQSGAVVLFGSSPCTSVSVLFPTQLTCVAPAHADGVVDITVTNLDGQTVTSEEAYTYHTAPTVTSVSPASGTTGGFTLVTINGTNFSQMSEVTIGGLACTSLTPVSSTQLTCRTPAHAAGATNVVVSNNTGLTGTAVNAYTFVVAAAPTVTSISPTSGSTTGGTTVTITGTGFLDGINVKAGGANCTSVNVVSSTSVTCVTPAHAIGAVDILVTNTDGQANSLTNSFTYFQSPLVIAVTPPVGTTLGGNSITITGSNFRVGTTVRLGVTDCPVSVLFPSSLTCTAPPHAAGLVEVTVTNPDGQSSTLASGYAYAVAPTVTATTPATGSTLGGTGVTLTGTGFQPGATVKMGGVDCTSVSVISPTSLTCTAGAHAVGAVDVVVTDINTVTGTLSSGFTYVLPTPDPAPTVSAITPTSGPTVGGTLVTLTGTGFAHASTSIKIGGAVCSSPIVLSSTSMTCISPPRVAGAGDVVATNADAQTGALPGAFTFIAPPAVTSITPSSGTTAGGTPVTLIGTAFTAGATVSIGSTPCTSVSVDFANQITCVTPAHAAGIVDVIVTNPDAQTGTLFAGYTFISPPTITAVSPASGTTGGTTTITLTGTNFGTGATVTLGGSPCSPLNVNSSTQIVCITPAHDAGAVDVTINNTNGLSGTLNNGYTFAVAPAPTVSSISPTSGPTTGNAVVTLTGTGFLAGMGVKIGGNTCSSVIVSNATTASCRTAAHAAGAADVSVTNTDGQTGALSSAYTFISPPVVASVVPGLGTTLGGTSLSINGTGFLPGATVLIGSSPCGGTTVIFSSLIVCTAPAHAAGVVDITVTNTDGQLSTLTDSYTYTTPPAVTSISPVSGTTGGGTLATITGTSFSPDASVTIGGSPCPVVSVASSTSIVCRTPAHAAGAADVVVTNSNGLSGSSTGAYTFVAVAAPTLSSISPTSGSKTGGTTVTLTGTNFLTGATVLLGGSACTSVNVTAATSLTCTTPAHAVGAVDVVINNTDGQSANLTNAFTYHPAPTVTAANPLVGTTAGGNSVTITGTGFRAGATVTLGILDCPVTVSFPNALTCTAPAHDAGVVNVTVTNTDGQASTLLDGYSYAAPPTVSAVNPTSGTTQGLTPLTLTGTGFRPGVTVSVGGLTCDSVSVASPTSLTCITRPHAAATVDVVVTDINLVTGTLAGGYDYVADAAPTVVSVSPTSGPTAGGTVITITGTSYQTGATVKVGGLPCTAPTVVNATTMTCISAARVAGAGDVVVTNADGQTGLLVSGFTFIAPPNITNVAPTFGTTLGGTTVIIIGTGFTAGATVTLGSVPCASSSVDFATQITCVSPAHAAGVVDVAVANTDGQTSIFSAGYTFVAPPVVTSVAPLTGTTGGGTTVTITGSAFVANAGVLIGGSPCTSVSVISSTTITCVTPAHAAGAVTAQVTNTNGLVGSAAAAYTYVVAAAPTVSGISPASGPTTGGSVVVLTGTGFLDGIGVRIGGNTCTDVIVSNSTTVSCRTPAHALGGADIRVVNTDGQVGVLNGAYTFVAPPVIGTITPLLGTTLGGTSIAINGTGFLPGATVDLGSSTCGAPTVIFPTLLVCVAPAHAAGVVDVTVTNSDGQTTTAPNAYTFVAPPTVATILPVTGTTGGGTPVTIAGTNFLTGATVAIGGSPCTSVSVTSATEITCLTPAHSAGATDVVVTNTNGLSGSSVGAYTFAAAAAPAVTSIAPTTGPISGGTVVTITGTDFLAGATVKIGSATCASPTVVNATTITCTTAPRSAGIVDIVVTNTDAQVGTLNNSFEYLAPPIMTAITPAFGPVAGGNSVVITGTGFRAGITATFGTNDCPVTLVFPTEITCTAPAHDAGPVTVVVNNTDNQSNTALLAYTYLVPPTVTAIAPSSGRITGGTAVTLTGTGFVPGSSVKIGGVPCEPLSIASLTSMSCTTAAHTAGVVDVVVTSPSLITGTLSNGYTYVPPPAVTSLAPSSGTKDGGTAITITGTGFSLGATVALGGTNCGALTVNSATEIVCTSGAHAIGAVDVVVTNTDGQIGTKVGGYTYVDIDFNVTVAPVTGAAMVMHLEGDWTLPCKITAGQTSQDIRCVVEVDEFDLFKNGVTFNYNVPGAMCPYSTFQPYFFLAREAGFGPTAVTLAADPAGNLSIVSQTPSTNSPNAVAQIVNNALVCDLNDTCEGPLTLTDPDGNVSQTTWSGKIANAAVGPAMDSQQKYTSGFPKPDLRFLAGTTFSSSYAVTSPETKALFSNAYVANWFNGAPDYLYSAAPTPMNVIPFKSVARHDLNPWYEWGCLDNSHEYINRIRVLVRSWSTHAQFALELAGNPSVNTAEGIPFDDNLNMDYQVWPAAGGGFNNNYPGLDL